MFPDFVKFYGKSMNINGQIVVRFNAALPLFLALCHLSPFSLGGIIPVTKEKGGKKNEQFKIV